MKKLLLVLSIVISTTSIVAAKQNPSYIKYIEEYKDIAIREMNTYRIPASITLAQGLLESGAGKSELSKKSNNHFGIKCRNSWTGKRVYHDDDEKGECFRKYEFPIESYEDHSKFLVDGSRYDFLFEYATTDYKSWAHGLKKAGYATNPKYANLLIGIIENYNLSQYDRVVTKGEENSSEIKVQKEETPKKSKSFWNIFKKRQKTTSAANLERNTVFKDDNSIAEISPFRTHEIKKINGVKCTIALPGDTYESIADELEMYEKELLKANEVQYGANPEAGDVVFLAKKKKKGKESATYTAKKGETVYMISQKTGIRVRSLYRINGLVYGKQVNAGDIIKLR